jgi:hypothetical protein
MLGAGIERRMSRSQTNLLLNSDADGVEYTAEVGSLDTVTDSRTSAARYSDSALRSVPPSPPNASEGRAGEIAGSDGDSLEEKEVVVDVLMKPLWEANKANFLKSPLRALTFDNMWQPS